jgi:hypothetical protein
VYNNTIICFGLAARTTARKRGGKEIAPLFLWNRHSRGCVNGAQERVQVEDEGRGAVPEKEEPPSPCPDSKGTLDAFSNNYVLSFSIS